MNLLLLSWGASTLAQFLTDCTGRPLDTLRVGLIDDAAIPLGDNGLVVLERERLDDLGCQVETIRARDISDPEDFGRLLDALDAVYVCAGETFVLLDSLHRNGLRSVLADKVRAGLPYIGLSAGSVIAGPNAAPVSILDDPALAPGLTDFSGLALIDSVPIPHADGLIPAFPPEQFERIRREYGDRFALTFINDDQALLVYDGGSRLIASPDR